MSDARLTLYSYWRSSSSWRVRIALAWKRLAYEYVAVHLLKEGGEQHQRAFRALNPMEQVPVLGVREGSRSLHLRQSLAIIEYLEERWPAPPLLPSERGERAQARALAELVNSGIQPLQNLGVLQHVRDALGGDERAWAAHWVGRGLEALEQAVRESAGTYCVGDAVSYADLCLIPQLYSARRFGVEVDAYPTLTAIEARCATLDAFREAHAERQSDAVAAG